MTPAGGAASLERSTKCDVSVVVPTYNGLGSLEELCRRIATTLDTRDLRWEILLVDDSSPDATPEFAASLQRSHPELRYVRLPNNRGQHAATVTGMRMALGEIVVTMDDDLQHAPESIPLLLDALNCGIEVAIARFETSAHATWRQLGSRIVAGLLQHRDDPHRLEITSFKAFRRRAVQRIVDEVPVGPFYLARLILACIPRAAIANVDVPHYARKHGRSNYGPVRLLRLARRAISGVRDPRLCR